MLTDFYLLNICFFWQIKQKAQMGISSTQARVNSLQTGVPWRAEQTYFMLPIYKNTELDFSECPRPASLCGSALWVLTKLSICTSQSKTQKGSSNQTLQTAVGWIADRWGGKSLNPDFRSVDFASEYAAPGPSLISSCGKYGSWLGGRYL